MIANLKVKAEIEEHKRKTKEKLDEDIRNGITTQAAEDRKAELLAEKAAEDRKIKEEEQAKKRAERLARGEKDLFPRPPRKITEHGPDIELLSKLKIRFSRSSFTYVSSLIDLFLHEQIEFAMTNVIKKGRSILLKRHVLEQGCSDLSLNCLYNDLPIYRKARIEETNVKNLKKLKLSLKKLKEKLKLLLMQLLP